MMGLLSSLLESRHSYIGPVFDSRSISYLNTCSANILASFLNLARSGETYNGMRWETGSVADALFEAIGALQT